MNPRSDDRKPEIRKTETDSEPYFVDHLGFHEDVHYKVDLLLFETPSTKKSVC